MCVHTEEARPLLRPAWTDECNATQRNATQRNATQCNATQRNAMQCLLL